MCRVKVRYEYLLSPLIIFFCMFCSYPAQAQYTFECNFDNGFCMGSRHCGSNHDCETENLPIVPDPGGRQGFSLMSKLWKTDERAEVRSNPNYTPPLVNRNNKPEAWYSVKYFFPGSYDWGYGDHDCPNENRGSERGNQTIIWQLNSYPMKNPRPCQGVGSHFKQCKDKIYFEFQRSDGNNGTECTKHLIGDIITNKWLSLVLHAKWSGDEDGFLQIWYDGNLVLDESSIRTYWHNEDDAPKNKFGLYYGDPWTNVDAPDEKVIYIDDIRIKDGESSFYEMCPDIIEPSILKLEGITFSEGIILTSLESGSVIRNCVFRKIPNTMLRLDGARNVLIENCIFDDTKGTRGKDIHQIVSNDCEDIIIRGCIFIDAQGDGIQFGHNGTNVRNVLIENNTFYNSHKYNDYGENGIDLKIVHDNIVIRNNCFFGFRPCRTWCTGCDGSAIVIHKGAQNVILDGNIFYDNTKGLKIEMKRDLPPINITVMNNIFYDNQLQGLEIENVISVSVYHNTFVNNGVNMTVVGTPIEGGFFNYENNLFVGTGGCYESGGSNLYFADVAEVKFANPETRDYRLTSASPAINKGISLPEVQTDIDGQDRDTSPDVGADECDDAFL